ncbi:uncharacterized protein LOC125667806 [Ostrea edulis]|uniref:uncharacterized protein LOC125667806 n=1 Tax=Ostrea edulis TaxID=37623 RepID=UPI0024AFDED1|nr:uncharacterized protein LOC125667806 [Ostrea edulis]XP_056004439.1 uncharacterized protein LOC125667806 [Ostrea edulis]
MPPKKLKTKTGGNTPTQKSAANIARKYKACGKRMSPKRRERVRRALYNPAVDGEIAHVEQSSSLASTKIIIDKCVVKGYHVFKIRPPYTPPPTRLIVDREYSNIKDSNACLVWLPPLNNFPPNIHNDITDEKRQLKVSDIAGLPIGHVPKCLSAHFRNILDNGGEIFAEVTGQPVVSFPPWPEPNEEGGGVVLPCKYILENVNASTLFDKLKTILSQLKEGDAMKLYTL